MIVIETAGSPYERGVQHGQQCDKLIHTIVRSYKAQGKLAFDVLPALHKIARCFPQMFEEMVGIAHGAQLPRDDIFRLNLQQLDAAPCCSVIGVRGESGHPWLGKTDDIAEHELGWNILQRATTPEGNSALYLHFAGTVWFSTAFTDAGFCMAMTGLLGAVGSAYGIPWVTCLPLLPARCHTVDDAEMMLAEFELDYGGFSLLLADANRECAIVEKTSQGQATRKLELGGQALCHTNHCCFGTLSDPPDSIDTTLGVNSRARLDVVARRASEYSHSNEGLQKLLRDHSSPGAICQHGEAGLHTDYAVILSPSLDGLWLSAGPACKNSFQFHSIVPDPSTHAKLH